MQDSLVAFLLEELKDGSGLLRADSRDRLEAFLGGPGEFLQTPEFLCQKLRQRFSNLPNPEGVKKTIKGGLSAFFDGGQDVFRKFRAHPFEPEDLLPGEGIEIRIVLD